MKKLVILIAVLGIVGSMISCRKIDTIPTDEKTIRQLNIADDFKWNTTNETTLNIQIQGDLVPMKSRITVYDANPFEGGSIVFSGSVTIERSLETTFSLSANINEVYIKWQSAEGFQELLAVPVVDHKIEHTFSHVETKSMFKNVNVVAEPDCNSGCNQTISGSSNVQIKNGQTYCVTSSFTGNINFMSSGGTLKVCGTVNIGNVSLANNCYIIVTSTGSFTANGVTMSGNSTFTAYGTATVSVHNLNLNGSTSSITNFTDNFHCTSTFAPNGIVYNYGTITVDGNISMNGNSGNIENYNSILVNGDFSTNNDLLNEGIVEVTGHMNINSGAEVINDCKIIVHLDLSHNNATFVNNSGYVKCFQEFSVTGGAYPILNNSSMISTYDFVANTNVYGYGTLNTIKVSNDTRINGQNVISGAIEVADNNGVMSNGNASNYTNGASFVSWANATNYLPITGCNPEGFGQPPVTDTDNDGVADNFDDYPNDHERAFNNYYPSENTWGTLMFEDLWPAVGDYDFNDLVLMCRYNLVANASNNIVEVKTKYAVRAVGASYHNGFGIQFDNLNPSQIESVNGCEYSHNYITLNANGTEASQSKAVVIVFDDPDNVITRAGGSFFNTLLNGTVGTSDTVDVVIHFTSPVVPASVGTPPFNPFIIRNATRGAEIHLADGIPTSLVDESIFGTLHDSSDPASGRYYKSELNLPWAMYVPEEIDYMVEYIEITDGYYQFGTWAESRGGSSNDWYIDNPGYRNNTNIWHP